MEKYKLCPGCGFHNNPLAIECEECGEDLSSVRILDAQTEEQLSVQASEAQASVKPVKMIRVCEECGAKNEPQARKCISCGEDISMVMPTPDEEPIKGFSLASTDGEYIFPVPDGEDAIVIGRENEMQDYLKDKLYVSRRHAELSVVNGSLHIKSYASATNGTHVNGVVISPDEEIEIKAGDIIGMGGNDPAVQKDAAYFQVIES